MTTTRLGPGRVGKRRSDVMVTGALDDAGTGDAAHGRKGLEINDFFIHPIGQDRHPAH